MASTRTKNLARAIQRANPDMKYTEALRHAEAEPLGPISMSLRYALKSPEETRADLSRIADRLIPGGRTPWPLQVGTNLDEGMPAVLLPLENDANLAVCGNAKSGHTATLRSLARSALTHRWSVSVVGIKADEFGDLRERHPQRVTALPGGRFISEEEGQAFLEGTRPGTAQEPRLVIIDNGDYLFDFEAGTGGEEWVGALESLMTHPHTAVVLQSTSLNRRLIPAQIVRHFNARLLLGRNPEEAQRTAFRDVVPREVFDAFEFSQPAWTGTVADRGRGVLWDGERLVRIQHDPLDPQGDQA